MSRTSNAVIGFSAVTLALSVIGFFVYFLFWLSLIKPHQLAYWVDNSSGEYMVMQERGWVVTSPMKRVYKIDLRPEQVCIYANDRIIDCKTVNFDPEGFDEFLAMYGEGDYSFHASSSTSSSSGTSPLDLGEILKYHAFDTSRDPPAFIHIESRLKGCP